MIEEEGIENKIFSRTFGYLKFIGVWMPTTIRQRWLQFCWRIYTTFTVLSICMMVIGTLSDIVTSGDNFFLHFVESWPLTAVCSHIVIRAINMMRNQKRIVRLLREKMMVERWMNLRDAEEIELIENSKIAEQKILFYWLGLVTVNGFMNIFNPIITSNPENNLIFKSWVPCNRMVSSCYWTCWSYQVLGYVSASITHVAADCVVLNFIERLCTHFRIVQHRLDLLPYLVKSGVLNTAEKERRYVKECILDHQNIYYVTNEISEMFNVTTFIHFTMSFSILCTNIYFVSKQPLFTTDFLAVFLFLCCMLAQGAFNCWYGYKLVEFGNKIVYTIFTMDLFDLRKDTKETLRFIMLCASKSISLFNNFIVELSPESFLKMLKISYSAFNLLQTRN